MKHMNTVSAISILILAVVAFGRSLSQEKAKTQDTVRTYTYIKDVAPIIKTYCLTCHGSDNENPSEYYMDDYESIMKGGRHGVTIVTGKPDSSMFYYKLLPDPPFGKQMPRGHKKISPQAIHVIHDWIEQGAKKQ